MMKMLLTGVFLFSAAGEVFAQQQKCPGGPAGSKCRGNLGERHKLELILKKKKKRAADAASGAASGAASTQGAHCGSVTFDEGSIKEEDGKEIVEFKKIKHSRLNTLDDVYYKELAVEQGLAQQNVINELSGKEWGLTKKMALMNKAKDSLKDEIEAKKKAEVQAEEREQKELELKKMFGAKKRVNAELAKLKDECRSSRSQKINCDGVSSNDNE